MVTVTATGSGRGGRGTATGSGTVRVTAAGATVTKAHWQGDRIISDGLAPGPALPRHSLTLPEPVTGYARSTLLTSGLLDGSHRHGIQEILRLGTAYSSISANRNQRFLTQPACF